MLVAAVLQQHLGEVVEWLMALVLKTSEVKASAGSNPALSVLPSPQEARDKPKTLVTAGVFLCPLTPLRPTNPYPYPRIRWDKAWDRVWGCWDSCHGSNCKGG